jgi:hypothetical protein
MMKMKMKMKKSVTRRISKLENSLQRRSPAWSRLRSYRWGLPIDYDVVCHISWLVSHGLSAVRGSRLDGDDETAPESPLYE